MKSIWQHQLLITADLSDEPHVYARVTDVNCEIHAELASDGVSVNEGDFDSIEDAIAWCEHVAPMVAALEQALRDRRGE